MTEQEHKKLRDYCAFLLKEYGFEFPVEDPVIIALYIIHQEMKANSKRNEGFASTLKEAAARIHPQVYQFAVPGEAWKFQIAAAVKWILIGLAIVLTSWSIAWIWFLKKDVRKAKEIIQVSQNVQGMIKHVKINERGYYFIDFTASKGDSVQNFTEFEKLSRGKIRVYLGKTQ